MACLSAASLCLPCVSKAPVRLPARQARTVAVARSRPSASLPSARISSNAQSASANSLPALPSRTWLAGSPLGLPSLMPKLDAVPKGKKQTTSMTIAPMEGKPNAWWRILSVIPYVLPLIEGLVFGREVYLAYPFFTFLLIPFTPVLMLYHANGFTPFIVFFCLFLFVCRNMQVPHFVRFNAMQAILLDICLMLAGLVISYLPEELACNAMVGGLLNTMTFMLCLMTVVYCVVYTLKGSYCDIPIVSEATYLQLQ
eukprot:jgi/Mesvir1/3520/Mv11996-RA.1